ncbi:hypothetical protein BJ322DRAFT_1093022 [Thelephora terrestris]|uniref:Uncharacterized protein n=1 Tax=Thelephora terrestris TaxID=56493 RepID=A0A9P6H3K3_9AGAM|nr:hypothetical protein BJ322DRAFT_1093022 [Thelephora terrestris]
MHFRNRDNPKALWPSEALVQTVGKSSLGDALTPSLVSSLTDDLPGPFRKGKKLVSIAASEQPVTPWCFSSERVIIVTVHQEFHHFRTPFRDSSIPVPLEKNSRTCHETGRYSPSRSKLRLVAPDAETLRDRNWLGTDANKALQDHERILVRAVGRVRLFCSFQWGSWVWIVFAFCWLPDHEFLPPTYAALTSITYTIPRSTAVTKTILRESELGVWVITR